MGKHNKTRKEKIIADLNRKIQIQANGESIFFSQTQEPHVEKTVHIPVFQAIEPARNSYTYLFHDIKKSFLITSSIIAFEIVLFLIMQRNIVSLLHR